MAALTLGGRLEQGTASLKLLWALNIPLPTALHCLAIRFRKHEDPTTMSKSPHFVIRHRKMAQDCPFALRLQGPYGTWHQDASRAASLTRPGPFQSVSGT